MKTRKQYLDKEVTHEEYYSQFVTNTIKSLVSRNIGKSRIKASQDEHLNDIPLSEWDGVAIQIRRTPSELGKKMKEAGDYCTLAGLVCIAKEAARQLAIN
jgi:hypothetical protein